MERTQALDFVNYRYLRSHQFDATSTLLHYQCLAEASDLDSGQGSATCSQQSPNRL